MQADMHINDNLRNSITTRTAIIYYKPTPFKSRKADLNLKFADSRITQYGRCLKKGKKRGAQNKFTTDFSYVQACGEVHHPLGLTLAGKKKRLGISQWETLGDETAVQHYESRLLTPPAGVWGISKRAEHPDRALFRRRKCRLWIPRRCLEWTWKNRHAGTVRQKERIIFKDVVLYLNGHFLKRWKLLFQ